jgi:hypothetical protein
MNNVIIDSIAYQIDLLKRGKISRADLMEELIELFSIEEIVLEVRSTEVEIKTPLYSMIFNQTKSYYN